MAGFLRKKSRKEPAPLPVRKGRQSPEPSAPPSIYSKFTSGATATKNDGSISQRTVSGPMSLGPRGNVAARFGMVDGRDAGRDEARYQMYNMRTKVNAPPRASSSTFVPPQTQVDFVDPFKSVPFSRAEEITRPPNGNNGFRGLAKEKPLPTPHHQEHSNNNLSSSPPKSILPTNRRISVRSTMVPSVVTNVTDSSWPQGQTTDSLQNSTRKGRRSSVIGSSNTPNMPANVVPSNGMHAGAGRSIASPPPSFPRLISSLDGPNGAHSNGSMTRSLSTRELQQQQAALDSTRVEPNWANQNLAGVGSAQIRPGPSNYQVQRNASGALSKRRGSIAASQERHPVERPPSRSTPSQPINNIASPEAQPYLKASQNMDDPFVFQPDTSMGNTPSVQLLQHGIHILPPKGDPYSASTRNGLSSQQQAAVPPLRGKPLIFSAMVTDKSSFSPYSPPPPQLPQSYPSPPTDHHHHHDSLHRSEFSEFSNLFNRMDATFDPYNAPQQPPYNADDAGPMPPPKPTNDTNTTHRVLHQHYNAVPTSTPRQRVLSSKSSLSSRVTDSLSNGHIHRTLTKPRPSTPVSPEKPSRKPVPSVYQTDLRSSIGIDLNDDPFAKPNGVKLLAGSSRDALSIRSSPPHSRDGSGEHDTLSHNTAALLTPPRPSVSPSLPDPPIVSITPPAPLHTTSPPSPVRAAIKMPPSPPNSPPEPIVYREARTKRRGLGLDKAVPPNLGNIPVRRDRPHEPFPMDAFLSDANLVSCLLSFMSFFDWCNLSSVSKAIRLHFIQDNHLKEAVLERFLKTVGYSRWEWDDPEPIVLSIADLHSYMHGVSLPTYEYARVAASYIPLMSLLPSQRDPDIIDQVAQLTNATRAYTRVVLRLRTQAERDAVSHIRTARARTVNGRPVQTPSSSRAPSPQSLYSQSQYGYSNGHYGHRPRTPSTSFQSPLFRLKRAPLLRVFVPSADGDWLSDASVIECEAELQRTGVRHLLRMGDVAWDIAVGDEGNVGRLVWDGSYLIDLDYSYSAIGDIPKYIPTLAFPPSYFHRVIRTGAGSGNPVVRIDLTPWGDQIAANLQLLQDRVRTETPQGAYHNVVRWVHRSSFSIRPPPNSRSQSIGSQSRTRVNDMSRIPIPDSNLSIDPGWYGTIVVETEGTNECLADLQDRCGPGAFPPRAVGSIPSPTIKMREDKDRKLVFRIMREKSRPGEIWIRAVSPKEKIF